MRYLVVGSGGREHTIHWRLLNDGSAEEVFAAPGNGGIDDRFRLSISPEDFSGIESACIDRKIDVVIVGPEAPLAAGWLTFWTKKKFRLSGPSWAPPGSRGASSSPRR